MRQLILNDFLPPEERVKGLYADEVDALIPAKIRKGNLRGTGEARKEKALELLMSAPAISAEGSPDLSQPKKRDWVSNGGKTFANPQGIGFIKGGMPEREKPQISNAGRSTAINTNSERREECQLPAEPGSAGFADCRYHGEPRNKPEETQSRVCLVDDGVPGWMDETPSPTIPKSQQIAFQGRQIKADGNPIVPQVLLRIYRAIAAVDKQNHAPVIRGLSIKGG